MDLESLRDYKVVVYDDGEFFTQNNCLVCEDGSGNIVLVENTEQIRNYFLQQICGNQEQNNEDSPQNQIQNQSAAGSQENENSSQAQSQGENSLPSRNSQMRTRWNNAATLLLIDAWKQRRHRFENNTERNEILWDEIASQMREAGYGFSVWQIENKFKYLKKCYLECVDKNRNSTGQPEQYCSYYEEMDELFHNSPQIVPPMLAASRRISSPANPNTPHLSENEDSLAADINLPSQPSTSENGAGGRTGRLRRRRTRLERAIGSWADQMRAEAQQREAARAQRHEELLTLLRDSNRIYEEMMKRLIDKL